MSHNHLIKVLSNCINQFDEYCKDIRFNFFTALVSIQLGSWIWLNDPFLSQFVLMGYFSGFIGFYLSNLGYFFINYLLDKFCNLADEKQNLNTVFFFKMAARMISTTVGFLLSDGLLGMPELNTGMVFVVGLCTIIFFSGIGAGLGLYGVSEDDIIEPGTPNVLSNAP